MKNIKNILRIFITLASVLGFLGGWATLAHARKPVQNVSDQSQILAPLAPLAPLPSLDSNDNQSSNNNPLNFFAPQQTAPRMRSRSMFSTGGS